MKASLQLFSYHAAPIKVHGLIVLAFLFFFLKDGIPAGIASGLAFFSLMLSHELGHAYFVKKYGHRLLEVRVYPIHGMCLYEHDARWRPETLVIAGGLLAQLALLICWLALLGILGFLAPVSAIRWLDPVTYIFLPLNALTILINLLPLPGLDGYELWRRFSPAIYAKCAKISALKKRRNTSINLSQSPEKVVELAIKRARDID